MYYYSIITNNNFLKIQLNIRSTVNYYPIYFTLISINERIDHIKQKI